MVSKYVTADNVNFRSSPQFGSNAIGSLHLAQELDVIGEQQGDQWMPSVADVDGNTVSGFVSKDLLRDPLSESRESLIQETIRQWLRFERGKGRENEQPFAEFVGEFWQSIGMDLDGLDRDVPWSAAFISYVIRKANGYDGFRFAAAHSRYVHRAIRAKLDSEEHPFWGYEIGDHKPQLGDMVCRWRAQRIDYDHAANDKYFKSHCDIVVQVSDNDVFTIGGNVRHSVRHTRYAIDDSGFLSGAGNVYAVLKNNL